MTLNASAAAADSVPEAHSPYRINIGPAPITRPATTPPAKLMIAFGPAYQLDPRYRPKNQQPKMMEAALPADGALASRPDNQVMPDKFFAYGISNAKLAQQPFSGEIDLAARAASLDPALVHAVIFVESRYRNSAISAKGAIGLMQILPDTAARYGIKDVGNSPSANLKAGTLYLHDLMRMFDNRIDLVLAAYNAGEGAVVKHSRQVPPYRETRQYVLAVLAKYNEWRVVDGTSPAGLAGGAEVTVPLPTKLAETARAEYLTGTRLVVSDEIYTHRY